MKAITALTWGVIGLWLGIWIYSLVDRSEIEIKQRALASACEECGTGSECKRCQQ